MSNFRIVFERPWFLLLLIPALLFTLLPHFLLKKKFRRTRNRIISVVMHSVAMVLCIALIAGISFSYSVPNRDNELLVLVDLSDSTAEEEEAKNDFLQSVILSCHKGMRVGVVSFGTDTVYAAPLSRELSEVYRTYLSAARPDTSATDIAGAISFAAAQFENPKSAKILLLSDGIETDGAALSAVKLAAAQGIKVDVAAFASEEKSEMQIIDVKMPTDKIIVGQEVKISLTVETNFAEEETVTVAITDKGFAGGTETLRLTGGVQTVEVKHTFQSAGMHDMIFTLGGVADEDAEEKNNSYHSYMNIPLFENVLILENIPGEADPLAALLAEDRDNVQVVNIHTDADLIPSTVRELSAYEEVILVNMANADLTADTMPANFVETLYDYVYNLGGGLFTVGGKNDLGPDGLTPIPHAYNRADMADTLFQQMLPVQVIDYTPPIAVMIVVDASGSMSMGKYEAALDAAEEILAALTDRDYCGVMTFSTSSAEAVNVIPVANRDKIQDAIRALKSGQGDSSGSGGTVFSGAIDRAGRTLAPIPVERRHIVLITDGNPSDYLEEQRADDPNAYGKYIDYNYRQNNITMSVFTVGMSGSREQMQKTAERGHGNYYDIPDSELDKITTYARQDLAAATLSEIRDGVEFFPKVKDQSSIFVGIDSTMQIPALTGYYGTKLKDGAKVPLIYDYVPIYAEWSFGAGRVGSFLSDLGGAWSHGFLTDETGIRLVKNIAESLAPTEELDPDRLTFTLGEEQDNYSFRLNVYTDLAEGESLFVKVLPISDGAYRVYGGEVPVSARGDGVGFTFRLTAGGVYRITAEKRSAEGETLSSRTVYRCFSYSEEYDRFREEGEGEALLLSLAADGRGAVIADPVEALVGFEKLIAKTADPRTVFLILAIVCVLIDVAVRKFKFKWPHELVREHRARRAEEQENESMPE